MIARIALQGLEFHARHGVYPHERETGNHFEVDIHVEAEIHSTVVNDDLRETVNYETLFNIVHHHMQQPSHLLETVAEKIMDHVLDTLPSVMRVEITVGKLNPPIGGVCKRALVTLTKTR